MGVNGTPAMVLSNGMVLPGYQGPKELKAFLDEHKKQTSGNWIRVKQQIQLRRREAVDGVELPADLPPLLQRLYASRRGAQRAGAGAQRQRHALLDAAHRR